MNRMRDWAADYARRGWPVFPVHPARNGICACSVGKHCTAPGKHPLTLKGVYDATTSLTTIEYWWSKMPDANIGLGCGDIAVLDVDGLDGRESLQALITINGRRGLDGPAAFTGGGGFHVFFQGHSELKNRVRVMPGLDIRSAGGYVVLPPSMHESGRRYTWVRLPHNTELTPMPRWMLDRMSHQTPRVPVGKTGDALKIEDIGPITQPGRNNELARVAGRLYRDGLTQPDVAAKLLVINQEKCSPPLSEGEVTKIARSVGRYH